MHNFYAKLYSREKIQMATVFLKLLMLHYDVQRVLRAAAAADQHKTGYLG
jgi:hypothetical protein